jgi:hypothetical protein
MLFLCYPVEFNRFSWEDFDRVIGIRLAPFMTQSVGKIKPGVDLITGSRALKSLRTGQPYAKVLKRRPINLLPNSRPTFSRDRKPWDLSAKSFFEAELRGISNQEITRLSSTAEECPLREENETISW